MDPLDLINLRQLMDRTSGHNDIKIGVIDGPVDFNHSQLKNAKIKTISDSQFIQCKNSTSVACMHKTFIAGILSGLRNSTSLAICPQCPILLRPIFKDGSSLSVSDNYNDINLPISTPQELAKAIIETIDAGAKIINLSIGISLSSLVTYPELQQAYDYALRNHVIIIAASGNQGSLGYAPTLYHPWVIPVASCDEYGKISAISNLGSLMARRGIMAPGTKIRSIVPNNKFSYMSGTSFVAPFVTGTIALLWSVFRYATSTDIITSIINADPNSKNRRSLIPPLVDAEVAFKKLYKIFY
ncbi:MAG TPA: S8 family serine peptidase [Nitrososphaeraceae archaeon]|nr:S8 family serine peptidase [Nitrososphaeraceae archaeon]